MEFRAWPKIPRLETEEMTVTEKIDGTNACIVFSYEDPTEQPPLGAALTEVGLLHVYAQSRTRFINPGDDNFGFANWVVANCRELSKLGPGRHYGEWWGQGIQRGYGLKEKRFSLFNVNLPDNQVPNCVSKVPVLHISGFNQTIIYDMWDELKRNGSLASPGFMNPEGLCVYLHNSRQYYKLPFNK